MWLTLWRLFATVMITIACGWHIKNNAGFSYIIASSRRRRFWLVWNLYCLFIILDMWVTGRGIISLVRSGLSWILLCVFSMLWLEQRRNRKIMEDTFRNGAH